MLTITIVAPVRFKDEILEMQATLEKRGYKVHVPIFEDKLSEGAMMMLHRNKIDAADKILVMNVGGYMGRGTYEEIGYCTIKNKPITYLEPLTKGGLVDGFNKVFNEL